MRGKRQKWLFSVLAHYPLTFFIGLAIFGSTLYLGVLYFVFNWNFDYRDLFGLIDANQTILLLVVSSALGTTLIASAIAYKRVCNLSEMEYVLWLQQRSTRTLFPILTPLHDWFRLRIAIYNWWHTKVYSSAVHSVILIVAVMAIGNTIVIRNSTLISQSIGSDSDPAADEATIVGIPIVPGSPTNDVNVIVPIEPSLVPMPSQIEAVPLPDDVVARSTIAAYRIYIDNGSRQTGEGWRIVITGVDSNGATVTNDSRTEVTIRSTSLPINFYPSNSYSNRTERYQLNNGAVTVFAIANEPGTTRVRVGDDTGIIAYSMYFTVVAPILDQKKAENPTATQPQAADITDDVATRRVNPPSPVDAIPEVGSIDLLNKKPEVKKTAEVAAVAGSALVFSAVSPLGTVLSNFFVQALVNGVSLFNISFIGISRRIRRREKMGTVVNAKSGLPIPGVFVELRDEYGEFVTKMLTDRSGAFGFISGNSGKFLLRIGNPLYLPYQSKLFVISDPHNQIVAERIALEPINEAHVDRLRRVVRLFRLRRAISVIDWSLLVLGTVFAIMLVYHNPSTSRNLLAILYAILWTAKAIDLARDRTSGVILDSTNRRPVGLAVVQLSAVTSTGAQVIRSAVTDSSGRFLFAVAKGSYQLVVARNGYQTVDMKIRGEDTNIEVLLPPA